MRIYQNLQNLERKFLLQNKIQTGDQITIDHGVYNHVVVVLGVFNGRIYITENQKGIGVRHITLGELISENQSKPVFVKRNFLNSLNQQHLIDNALLQTGKPYNLINHNCEHYVNSLVTGELKSGQIQKFFGLAAFAVFGIVIARS